MCVFVLAGASVCVCVCACVCVCMCTDASKLFDQSKRFNLRWRSAPSLTGAGSPGRRVLSRGPQNRPRSRTRRCSAYVQRVCAMSACVRVCVRAARACVRAARAWVQRVRARVQCVRGIESMGVWRVCGVYGVRNERAPRRAAAEQMHLREIVWSGGISFPIPTCLSLCLCLCIRVL